jgi:hypothetical protein
MEEGASIVEAKKHYTQQLIDTLTGYIYQGLTSIMEKCKDEKKVLRTFQEKLCSIPKWNQDIIDNEYKRITQDIESEFIDNLIEAVFISNVKVLSTVRSGKNKPINIKIPESKIFVHKCYIECARYIFQDPHLLDNRETHLSQAEITRNVKRANLAINLCIEKTIRDLIPIQKILENYLEDLNSGEIDNEDSTSSSSDSDNGNDNDNEVTEGGSGSCSYEVNPTTDSSTGDSSTYQDGSGNSSSSFVGNGGSGSGETDDLDYNESELFNKTPDLEVSPGSNIEDTPTNHNIEVKNIIIPGSGSSSAFSGNSSGSSNAEPKDDSSDPPFFSDEDD